MPSKPVESLGDARAIIGAQKRVESGNVLKANESVEVKFPQPFPRPPTVLISPRFRNAVKNVDTVVHVSETGFTVNSANAERDFYINYVAIER
jgi:hypothetical protein